MQRLGQSVRDHLGENTWTDLALDRSILGQLCVIEDVRYVNEARRVAARGKLIRLHCEDSISTDAGSHPSEAEVDLIPASIVAYEIIGSRKTGLDDLFKQIDRVMESFGVHK